MKGRLLAAAAALSAATPAVSGPPYLTDDPVPTEQGHWEIEIFTAGEGSHSDFDSDSGLDLNYGLIKDVQLTTTLPFNFTHERSEGWRNGAGDLEVAIKYRFYGSEANGVSAAIFPRLILPTSTLNPDGKTRLLLPLWVGKDFEGGTSLFGGGGYELNPGPGNLDFWQAGLALTHDLSDAASIGAEITRQGPDTAGATSQTRAGVGAMFHLSGPASFLVSAGPTWADHRTAYRFYAALGLNF